MRSDMADVKKDKWISVMIIPEDGAGVKKWRITARTFFRLKVLLGASSVLLVAGLIAILLLGAMYIKMRQYQKSNERLMAATEKLSIVAERLEEFEAKERVLRELLGSEIELPPAPEETVSASSDRAGEPAAAPEGNEIEQAIARREAVLRRKPDIWPVARAWQVSDWFKGEKIGRGEHFGIDIIAPQGSNVVAAAEGRVMFAGMDENLGLSVTIDHENGWETRYGHNHLLLVKYGDTVRKGQPIAIYGGTGGTSTGTHLHYEMIFRGRAMNPLDHLPKLVSAKNARR